MLIFSIFLALGCSDGLSEHDAGIDASTDAGGDMEPDGTPDAGADTNKDAGTYDGSDSGQDEISDATPGDTENDAGDDTTQCQVAIDHTPIEKAQLGDILIEADVSGAENVTLYYRRAGQVELKAIPMEQGQHYTATIPEADVTFAPMKYLIEATDGVCTVRQPQDDLYNIRIWGTKRITTEAEIYDYLPSVYDNLVVFSKEKAAGTEDNTWIFDLHSFEFTQITHLAKSQGAADIYGQNLVWVDSRNDDSEPNPDIYLYDLESGQEHQVTTDPLGQYGEVIFDRIIAWRDDRNMTGPIDGDIYLYDMGPDKKFGTQDDIGEIRLTPNQADQSAPDVHVDQTGRVRIVWSDFRDDTDGVCDANCNWNIYMYDFGPDGLYGTGDDSGPHQVTSDPLEQTSPVIYGHTIAWRDARDGDWLHPDIYYYDLGDDGQFGTQDDSGVRKLPVDVIEANDLDIWENRLVYDDYRNSSYEIYLFDFSSNKETAITSSPRGQFYPKIFGRTIVWQDARNNDPDGEPFDDIYVHVLP